VLEVMSIPSDLQRSAAGRRSELQRLAPGEAFL
jgi:hypothetical protein